MQIISYHIANTNDLLTGRGGLVCFAELLRRVGFSGWGKASFLAPGSNRGYSVSAVVTLWMLMLQDGGRCLEDVRHTGKMHPRGPI